MLGERRSSRAGDEELVRKKKITKQNKNKEYRMKKKNEANHRSDCDEPAGEIITAGPEVAARRAQIDVRPGPHGKPGRPPPRPSSPIKIRVTC